MSNDLKETKGKLDHSLLSEEFMKGQLSGLSVLITQNNNSGSASNRELASALYQISKFNSQQQDNRPYLERLTNKQLQAKVQDYVKQIIDFVNKWKEAETNSLTARQKALAAVPRNDAELQHKAWQEMTRRESNMEEEMRFNFRAPSFG